MRRFFRRVRRVVDFLPIIWKGEDWDYAYSVELFRYQLERTADYIEKRGHLANADDVVKEIRTATTLLENVYEEKYIEEMPDGTDKDSWIKVHEILEKQDKAERIVWKFIAHNIRKWWD